MDAFAGAVGVADSDGKATPVYSVCTPRQDGVFTPYYARLLRHMALSGFIESLSKGIRERSTEFRWAELAEVVLPVPPKAEQERIANFLIEQTARIDALVAEKERLVGVLGQHAQAITDAVTFSDSTTHAKLGYFVDLLPGYAFPSDEFSRDPSDIPLLRGVNVTPSGVRWDEAVYWTRDYDKSLERFVLRAGDVVMGMDRPWISTGARVTLIDQASAGALLLQRVCRLRAGHKSRQRFIYYALASDAFRQSVEVELTGVSVPHLSPEQILRFKIPVLSLQEQDERCQLADRSLREVASLQEHTEFMLEHLREYRSSLISAAVTGQLDISTFKLAA